MVVAPLSCMRHSVVRARAGGPFFFLFQPKVSMRSFRWGRAASSAHSVRCQWGNLAPTSPSRGRLRPRPGSDRTQTESKPWVSGRSPTSHALSLPGGRWIPSSLEGGPPSGLLCALPMGNVARTSPSRVDLRPGRAIDRTFTESKPKVLRRLQTSCDACPPGGTSIPSGLEYTPVRLPVPHSVHCQWGKLAPLLPPVGTCGRDLASIAPSRNRSPRSWGDASPVATHVRRVERRFRAVSSAAPYHTLCIANGERGLNFSLPCGPAAGTLHRSHLHGIEARGLAEIPDQLRRTSAGWNVDSELPRVQPRTTLCALPVGKLAPLLPPVGGCGRDPAVIAPRRNQSPGSREDPPPVTL